MIKVRSILTILCCCVSLLLFAQAPANWFNLDAKQNKVRGVSTERAYNELLQGKKASKVIVAVIDAGADIAHEDLLPVLWKNPGEIADNGIDDDHNGYVDDIYGWNFIGGANEDVEQDNLEMTRMYREWPQYESMDTNKVDAETKAKYIAHLKGREAFVERKAQADMEGKALEEIEKGITSIRKNLGTEEPTYEQLKAYQPKNDGERIALKNMQNVTKAKGRVSDFMNGLQQYAVHVKQQFEVQLNPEADSRAKVVGDNYTDLTFRYYGNNFVGRTNTDHGTHVSGIIGAARHNNKGMDGVANDVEIMVLRVVPDGDERDKDVANAVRYAVDHGAKIINMSFGKGFSPEKSYVDEAMKYAESRDVLIIHAAGNDALDIDVDEHYPSPCNITRTYCVGSWIEVGASSWAKGKNLPAPFSNYGKDRVDVFAPGVDIYSTTPGSNYAAYSGTSMAAPVTAGVAALIRSYYPELTAMQVKEIILKSAVKVKGKVYRPGTEKKVKMTDLCRTGGLVNAYEALKLAGQMSKK